MWTGLLLGLYLLVRWLLNKPASTPQSYGSDIVVLATMLFFSYQYRKTLQEEKVTLKELMQLNVWTGFVAAIVFGFALWLYGTVLDEAFQGRCISQMIESEQQGGNSVEGKADVIAVIRKYKLVTLSWIGAFRTFVMSILWAFVAALLFRTEKASVKKNKNKRTH